MGRIRSTHRAEAADEYLVPPQADEVLSNWARWAAPRHGAKRQVNILAKMAKADRWAGVSADLGAPPVHAGMPDAQSAWVAEKVICSPAFWALGRELILQRWLYRASPVSTCRLLDVPPQIYDRQVWRAACAFWDRYAGAIEREVSPPSAQGVLVRA